MPDSANAAQVSQIAEQVARAAIIQIRTEHPEFMVQKEGSIPPPLKWASAIIAGLFTAGTATLAFWVVSSISQMQVTVARIDERMVSGSVKDSRFEELDRRVSKNEAAIAEIKK